MKLRIEIDSNLEETEIVIKAAALTDEIMRIYSASCTNPSLLG